MKTKQIVVSGMRPTGLLHLGHYFGVLRNWKKMQSDYGCYFFVADWHSLTTEYSQVPQIRKFSTEMISDWIAAGVDPKQATFFIQSHVPQHAELHLLFSMIAPLGWLERVPSYKELKLELKDKDLSTYGFLGYPLLQTADVAIYKANVVPVGQDQVAHIELSREIVRRFNFLYKKDVFPEPEAMLTEAPKVPGTDGRKMSKSYDNSIYLSDSQEVTSQKIMKAVTDPARQRRTDPGNPDICPIFSYHKLVTAVDKRAEIDRECRKAGIGCVDCKKILLGNLESELKEFREKRAQIKNSDVEEIVDAGSQVARQKAQETLDEANSAMGL